MLNLECLSVLRWTPWLHMFLLYSIQRAGITSNSGTRRHRGDPLSETESEAEGSDDFWPEGRVSVLREPLRPGGGRFTLSDVLSEVSATAWGCYRCRDPQLQTQGIPPSAARVSPWFFPEKGLLLLHILQCLGNVVPEASFLTLYFPNLPLIPNCDDRSLIPSLLSLRFVLGEIQCLAAQVFQVVV